MVEHSGEKDEDKLDVTPEGETAGQISLEEARDLALQHARDNRAFYGRQQATQNLIWEVLSQKERRDYFDIRLAYGTAEGFRGKPGVERFTFDKRGWGSAWCWSGRWR